MNNYTIFFVRFKSHFPEGGRLVVAKDEERESERDREEKDRGERRDRRIERDMERERESICTNKVIYRFKVMITNWTLCA